MAVQMTDSVTGDDVAVVIPAYDAATTIGATLASVAAQTVRPAEVIVVDDGSADDTAEVADQWRGVVDVDVVRLGTNRGLSVARRTAIERIKRGLVALLDADDVWLPDHLQTMLAAYRSAPGLVTAQPLNWAPGMGVAAAPSSIYRGAPVAHAQRRAILRRNFVFIGTLFSRADYERMGGFRATLRRSEDWDLWIRMVRAGVRVTRADHPTVLYRIHPGSLSFGYANVESDIDVIEHALADAVTSEERRWARRSLRRLRGRAGLKAAFELVGADRTWRARAAALRTVFTTPRVALLGGAVVLAPRATTRARGDAGARVRRQL